MLCQECQKRPATVHMTKIVNNQKTEMHLCEECARQRNDFNLFTPFSINDLLASLMDNGKPHMTIAQSSGVSCSRCGMNYYQFKKTGRLGCQECYKTFGNEIVPILRRIQGGTQHSGKIPRKAGSLIYTMREIEALKSQLQEAIKAEAFEEAAELRDRIRELERQISSKEGGN